jgi:hypothetical protein
MATVVMATTTVVIAMVEVATTTVWQDGVLVSCPPLPCEGESRPLRGCALLIFP